MLIIGCDFHSRFKQITLLDTEAGEGEERRLEHENGEARAFYAGLGEAARALIRRTRQVTRRRFPAEEKIRIVLERVRGEKSRFRSCAGAKGFTPPSTTSG